MKEYQGRYDKVVVDGENISIIKIKKNTLKRSFALSDITETVWSEPTKSTLGSINITTKTHKHSISVFFRADNRDIFLELRDFITQKTGIEAQIKTNSDLNRELVRSTGGMLVAIAKALFFGIMLIASVALAFSGLMTLLGR